MRIETMNLGKHTSGVGLWISRCLIHANMYVNEKASAKNKYNTFYLKYPEFNKGHLISIWIYRSMLSKKEWHKKRKLAFINIYIEYPVKSLNEFTVATDVGKTEDYGLRNVYKERRAHRELRTKTRCFGRKQRGNNSSSVGVREWKMISRRGECWISQNTKEFQPERTEQYPLYW